MLIVFFLFTIALFSLYIVLKLFEPKFKVKKRIDVFIKTEQVLYKEIEDDSIKNKVSISSLRELVKSYIEKKVSFKNEEKLENKLSQAGNPMGMRTIDFQVYKVILKLILPCLFVGYGKILNMEILGALLIGCVGFLLSVFIPEFYLNQKIKQRHKQALTELPDFLDLLTVCLEAGLGFDGALNKVISKRTGTLSDEFHICIEEIRLGKTRKEALTGIKNRLQFDEMRTLINSILQGEKLGISIVQILRIKSQEEREKRKQRAEETAMKAPIKILFPLVIFIFPSIFTVLLGPAIIQLITQLGK